MFDSLASNLVAEDANDRDDIFVYDGLSGEVDLVSVNNAGAQGIGENVTPDISGDGSVVVFDSNASNLVPNDANGFRDVFVRDRVTNTTERVSVSASGEEGNAMSFEPVVSADGRFVAFVSDATNLAAGENNIHRDVFVRDRVTGVLDRASVSNLGEEGNRFSTPPDISADGRFVAFGSFANNLVPGDTNEQIDIFVHDRVTDTTERVSVDSSGAEANQSSILPSISGDGRFVAFASDASNLVPGDTNAGEFGLSGRDVFVHDRLTGTTERVSVTSEGGQANGNSAGPGFRGRASSLRIEISDDGRFVTFDSSASNLVAGDTNTCTSETIQFTSPGTCPDIFVHDRASGVTHRVSISSSGEQANRGSTDPGISGDGLVVGFFSLASNLVDGDTNTCAIPPIAIFDGPGECPDMFVHDVSGRRFEADVSVAIAASSDPALIGRTLTYTTTVRNDGPSDAARIVLTQALPSGARSRAVGTSAGTCAQVDATVRCALGGLAAGAAATVTIEVRPTGLDPLTTTASVTSRPADPAPANNTATLVTTVATR